MKTDFYKEITELLNKAELTEQDKQMYLDTLHEASPVVQGVFLDMFLDDPQLLSEMAGNLSLKLAHQRGEKSEEEVYLSEKELFTKTISQTV